MLADTVPKNANLVGTRIVSAIKEYQTEEEHWKTRIVVQGCMDLEARNIVSEAGFVAPMCVRMLLILLFSLGYAIWTRDFKQAYLQGGHLTRKIYSRPHKEMRERLRGHLLLILSPIYGLREAGSYWGSLYLAMFTGKLSMTSTYVDRYFLYRHPERPRSSAEIAEHGAHFDAAAPSEKRPLKLDLERISGGKTDGLVAILVDDILFGGTDQFR